MKAYGSTLQTENEAIIILFYDTCVMKYYLVFKIHNVLTEVICRDESQELI